MIKKTIKYVSGSTGQTYNIAVLLTSNIKDLGFFDTYEYDDVLDQLITGDTYTVSGTCLSRLEELRKYTTNPNYAVRYIQSTGTTVSYPSLYVSLDSDDFTLDTTFITLDIGEDSVTADGLLLSQSDVSGLTGVYKFVYYIGGIKYIDERPTGSTATTTTFILANTQLSYNNFDFKPILKLESKQNMVENPRISSDVFIERQQLSVFETTYRLKAINSLNDLVNYAGGNYFKIYNNT